MDISKLATCYNVISGENSCTFKTAILKLPEIENPNDIESLEIVTSFDTKEYGNDIKTTEFHPNDVTKAASVIENNIVLWDISEATATCIRRIQLDGKHNPKFTTGKWNPHQNCNQVVVFKNFNTKE